ncbi:MATH domain-containing protein At5g43560-like [Olea europaea var. sylvestris]|uniref:MATH domain-containing protein At5g43560-like n=1 Tax=Olea europaea var. sylvestris TaxID=158386 RepID=UPI000C1D2C45|nr:MATH domain-containing protein At5g43560-like [Olea europaea var. sylvestris]XP_022862828.1 MATH domain-containing protein At5g43560-like [Olea europaea var. sylvestris]XP_022862829.1 MATH domain-containing protein At5g43560-like [Olea europaea var. sylvestris]
MAEIATGSSGTGRLKSLEGVSTVQQQQCQPEETLVEWRSSEQLENGIPSTSPPYWDISDDEGGMPFVPLRIIGSHVNEFLLMVLF